MPKMSSIFKNLARACVNLAGNGVVVKVRKT
jgi:hypothetical protein